MTKVEVKIGTPPANYGGFKDFTLTRSMEALSGAFSMSFSDQWSALDKPWPITPQDPIEIWIGGVILLKGYVDALDASLEQRSREYSIRGRDASADLVDCSAPTQFGEMRNLTLLQICQKLSQGFGIEFTEGFGNWNRGPIALHKVSEGDTVFDSIQEAANKAGALLIPDGRGGVHITNLGARKSQTSIIEGSNILSISFTRDYSQRYSEYKLNGIGRPSEKGIVWARGVGQKKSTSSLPKASVTDQAIGRYRPLVIKQRGQSDPGIVRRMAEFEAKTREAKSLGVTVTVQGFLQDDGRPWQINEEVYIVAPRIGLADLSGDTYVISQTTFEFSERGQVTELQLLPRNAFLTEPVITKKKKDQKGIVYSREGKQGNVKATIPRNK